MKKEIQNYRKYMKVSDDNRKQAMAFITIGIESHLKKTGKSLRNLAKEMHMSSSFISHIKNMKRGFSEKTLSKLSKLE